MKDKYIKVADLLEILEKLKEARKKRINCSKSAAIEVNAFNYCINIINNLKQYEL